MLAHIFAFLAGFIVSFLLTLPVLWLIKLFRAAQTVRDEGPASHQAKSGTPTMAGIGFVLAITILSLVFLDFDLYARFLAIIILVVGFALIGFLDDFLKIIRHQNLGLTFWQKIASQTLVAFLFCFILVLYSGYPWLLIPFWLFIIVGSANATNLTDGLDGLLAGCGAIAFFSFAVVAAHLQKEGLVFFSLVSSGAIAAFLLFNFPKAKTFMGDVGSLPIGAALAGVAVILRQEFLLALIGGVFVIEALSVILQVASYKFFKRRIFKMSPLHHHFELMGFAENKVVIGFWVAALGFGLLGCWAAW